MADKEGKLRRKKLLRYGALLLVCFVISAWFITQKIATECHYHPLLSLGITIGSHHIYSPLAIFSWKRDPVIMQAFSMIIRRNMLYFYVFMGGAFFVCYKMAKSQKVMDSHGTASFGDAQDVERAKLNAVGNGVVIGRNPFNHKIMLHDGPEHMFLGAPSRSGKGVGIIMPTGITWHHSIFFFDPKGELWDGTAHYRKNILKQKVMKFEPLCGDGSSARWNPYAEINFMSMDEMSDVHTINQIMVVKGEGGQKDPFWDNTAIQALDGVLLHLMYKHYQGKRPLPCPSDVLSYISSPGQDTLHAFTELKTYPHISPDQFLQKDGIQDENGKGQLKPLRNPLYDIYGEYVPDFSPYIAAMKLDKNAAGKIRSLEDLRLAILEYLKNGNMIDWSAPDLSAVTKADDIKKIITLTTNPFFKLLVHPKIAENASVIVDSPEQTAGSIMTSCKEAMSLYNDPLIRRNTEVSDFCFRDLLDPAKEVSLYYVLQPPTIDKLRPLTRLFVNTLIAKTVRDMKFDGTGGKKQRLLLMLDEFPQLKKLDTIENTLAICAGYGVKICIVAQSVSQLNLYYTRDNSILDNCHVQVYFTPGKLDVAKELSERIGDKTIDSVSHSVGKGLFDSGSNSISQQGRRLITPDELMRMSQDDEMVFVAGFRPILAKKIHWFLEKFFTDRINNPQDPKGAKFPPPKFSDTCTPITNFEELFAIHALDVQEQEEKIAAVAKAKAEFLALQSPDGSADIAEAQAEDVQLEHPDREPSEDPKAKEGKPQEAVFPEESGYIASITVDEEPTSTKQNPFEETDIDNLDYPEEEDWPKDSMAWPIDRTLSDAPFDPYGIPAAYETDAQYMTILRNYKEKENTDETEDDDCQFTHRAEADPQNPNFGKKEAHHGEKSRRENPEEIADFFFHSEEVAHEIVLSASAKTDLFPAIHEEFTAPWISPSEEPNPMVIRLLDAEGKAG